MNKELILKVADYIEAHPDKHDQYTWAGQYVGEEVDGDFVEYAEEYVPNDIAAKPIKCDTRCCIAGWAVHLATPKEAEAVAKTFEIGDYCSWTTWGQRLLGLDDDITSDLFDANYKPKGGVPNALRHLAETGELLK